MPKMKAPEGRKLRQQASNRAWLLSTADGAGSSPHGASGIISSWPHSRLPTLQGAVLTKYPAIASSPPAIETAAGASRPICTTMQVRRPSSWAFTAPPISNCSASLGRIKLLPIPAKTDQPSDTIPGDHFGSGEPGVRRTRIAGSGGQLLSNTSFARRWSTCGPMTFHRWQPAGIRLCSPRPFLSANVPYPRSRRTAALGAKGDTGHCQAFAGVPCASANCVIANGAIAAFASVLWA